MKTLIFITVMFFAAVGSAEGPNVLSENSTASSDELAIEVPAAKASTSATSPVSENAIPVRLQATKGEPDTSNDLQRRVWLGLAMILGTAALSFILLRKYRVVGNKKTEQFNMKVLSQHHLGPRKSLAVVRVAGESILIGVTDHHISMIKSLSLLDEDMPEETPPVFSKVFEKKNQSHRDEMLDESVDSFALSSIQDVVNKKVKSLRTL